MAEAPGDAGPTDGATPSPLPAEFVTRCRDLEDAIGAPLLEPLATRTHVGLRVRTLRGDGGVALAELQGAGIRISPVADRPAGHLVPGSDRDALVHSDPVARGDIYIQGISSQWIAALLGVQPGMRVLDLAAAPGGKTLILADDMTDRGELIAVEKVRGRFFKLQENVRNAGATAVQATCMDGRRLPAAWADSFDAVLLDAPCSAEARIDPGNPSTFDKWSLRKVRDMASKQFRMLGAALRVLGPGREMIYATCSLAPEENEAQLAAWLDRQQPAVELLPLGLPDSVPQHPGLTRWLRKRWPAEVQLARRILPDGQHEAMFAARLRRS